tara:strand:+ start:34 stop:240 length:207 start_codon:yes stop_codon:yes gene_type:complete
MKSDKSIDEIFREYVWNKLRPPFKNEDGEYVNEYGELIDMRWWDNVTKYMPHKVRTAIYNMKKRGKQK